MPENRRSSCSDFVVFKYVNLNFFKKVELIIYNIRFVLCFEN